MNNSIKSKNYWIKLLPVIILHILYLIFCNSFDKFTRVYFDLVFYLLIAIYFFVLRDWRFSEWGSALKTGKAFWLPVLFTVLGLAAAFAAGFGVALLFPGANDGMGVFGINSWPTLIAFALVTILLPPIAEEAFYRKAVTAFDTKTILVASTIISIFLFASEHSLMPLGFVQACLWAVPFNLAYIKTKNIYVCMTAHFLCNFIVNGMTVITSAKGLW
ncbi:MAG: CPBP family intramembrane metalloprotease [Oscillospiraceae bacterium]|nr:CPBP family intramembrane metalloprotease [Oscillospiraceae bacterium]